MPYPSEHAARIRDPRDLIKSSYKRKEVTPGISIVMGKLTVDGEKGPMTAQAYRFDKDKFTEKQAKEWLKKHKIKTILFEPAKDIKEVIMGKFNIDDCVSKTIDRKKKMMGEQGETVASGSNLTKGNMVGSLEQKKGLIDTAVKKAGTYGKYPYVISTFDDYILIEADPGDYQLPTKYYKVPYEIKDGAVKLGQAVEIEKQVKFVIKEIFEEVLSMLFESVWTTKMMNDLPDSCFAFVKSGGTKDKGGKTIPRGLRYLPYKGADGKIDLPHLRNALARLPQSDLSDDEKKKAQAKLDAAAKEAKVGTAKK